jgi:hypothetical protein
MDIAVRDGDFFNVTRFHLFQELGKADGVFLNALAGADDGEKQHRHTDQNYPENQCLNVRVHETSVPVAISIDAARCDRDSNTVIIGLPIRLRPESLGSRVVLPLLPQPRIYVPKQWIPHPSGPATAPAPTQVYAPVERAF